MCRVLKVHRSGYYAWKTKPQSNRTLEDSRLLLEIKQSYDDSYGIYGSPRIHRDLREAGIYCGVKRVARLMHQAKLKSIRGYRTTLQVRQTLYCKPKSFATALHSESTRCYMGDGYYLYQHL